MALVANMLNAVGGEAKLTHREFIPSYPTYMPYGDRSFVISLGKFSRQSIETFMRIERPEPVTGHLQPGAAPHDSGAHQFATIGEFYDAVKTLLESLCREYGEERVFKPRAPGLQITTEYYYGGAGEIFPVECAASAERAIKEILDQGEGAPGRVFADEAPVRAGGRKKADPGTASDALAHAAPAHRESGSDDERFRHIRYSGDVEPAHYYRFREVYEGRYFAPQDTARSGPTGPEFPVQWDRVHDMRANPRAADYPQGSAIRQELDGFNRTYMRLLHRLEAGFGGDLPILVNAVVDMYELKERAVALMQIPSGDGPTRVGPSFEYVELAVRDGSGESA